KEDTIVEGEVEKQMNESSAMFKQLGAFIKDVQANVDMIYTPTMVVQASKDAMINTDSANYIYEHVESDEKAIKWYEESGHVITLDKEKDKLHEDIYQFLETLNWEQ